jgi:hypothetical protein
MKMLLEKMAGQRMMKIISASSRDGHVVRKGLLSVLVMAFLVCSPVDLGQYPAPRVMASMSMITPEGEALLPPPAGQRISLQRGWTCSLTCQSSDTSLPESVRTRGLVFGVDPAALNGLDSLDILLPPIPPGAAFEVYFTEPVIGRLSQDIKRPACERITWAIETRGTAGSMRWNPEELPAGQSELNGSLSGTINMRDIPEAPFAGNATLTILVQSCAGVKGDVNADGVMNILDVLRRH